ncbi:hypothetical protein F5144DRAFT_596010 [Chaetomium tenue]|uniref:Uncharacterized protein n=1 Tax=Chaetomium tenue TaxID=1854479 RepID=A0ACB7NZZ4_9PEZI|nr:hypothetical protein F5144DRAFT_596010 [Chaetomium globosum]
METIHESRQKGAGTPSGLPEAALFSVVKPNQRTTDVVLSAAMDGLTGRSSSLKTPLGKKTSFRVRDWAKRSNSNRTAATTEMTPSEALKSHIKHLGGGRLDNVQTQGTANNTTLLAPPPMRTLRRRASSIESRATQWLDFYTGSPDPNKSHSEPLPKPSASTETPRQRQRAGSNSSLRPAPLRVPSSERQNKPISAAVGSPPPPPPTNPLERKNSKWKPLPNLPAQPGGSGTPNEPITPPHKHQEDSPNLNLNIHSDPAYPAFLPVFRFDSPPPTPDSSTGIAAFARTHAERERDEQTAHTKREEQKAHTKRDEQKAAPGAGPRTPPLAARAPILDRPGQQQQQQQQKQKLGHTPKPVSAHAPAPGTELPQLPQQQSQPQQSQQSQPPRHTRAERVWLHVNYRGEAPFLRAWGLDIGKVEDRVDGVEILRELMRADVEDEYNSGGGGGGDGKGPLEP